MLQRNRHDEYWHDLIFPYPGTHPSGFAMLDSGDLPLIIVVMVQYEIGKELSDI